MLRSFFWTTCLLILAAPSFAVDPSLDWRTLSSDNFHIHYAPVHRAIAEDALGIAESVHTRLSTELNWQPEERTHLVISDESDYANGYATPVHINRSVLFLAPPTGPEGLEDFDDWMHLLITHEYTHVLHLDKAESYPASLRRLFGRFLLTFPNLFEPFWLIEGLATYKETDHERGIGRGQSAYYEGLMRIEAGAGLKPVEQVNLPISSWPSGTTRYLYGVYFFEFLADVYGEEAVQRLVENHSEHLLPFAVNTTMMQTVGKDLSTLWGEFDVWLQGRFAVSGERVVGENISRHGYRTSAVTTSGDSVYYIEDDGSHQPRIVEWMNGDIRTLTEVHQLANIEAAGDDALLIVQPELCDNEYLYSDLYLYDVSDDETQRLTECARYVHAVAEGDSIYAFQNDAGRFSLHELDMTGALVRVVRELPEKWIAGAFDVSPSGTQLALSLWEEQRGWNLYRYDLADDLLVALTEDTFVQSGPEFDQSGHSIYYASDYDGLHDVYRFEIDLGEHSKMTNSHGIALHPAVTNDALYYVGYSDDGKDVYRKGDLDVLGTIETGRGEIPRRDPSNQVRFVESEYSPLDALRPRWWFPTLAVTEDVTEFGFSTSANDALGAHNYYLNIGFDVDNDQPLGQLVYQYDDTSIAVQRENAFFKTNTGIPVRIRSSHEVQLAQAFPFTSMLTYHALIAAVSIEKSFDSALFPGAIPVSSFRDDSLALAWIFNNSRSYPLSISRNDGRTLSAVYEEGDFLNSDFPGNVTTLSWSEYLRLGGEHVLAFNLIAGEGDGITSAFELGGEDTGFGYSVLLEESGPGLIGRRDYPLRGYASGLPQLRGQNMRFVSAEWRFPGQRIERGIMTPPLGIMQWSGGIFLEAGDAYSDGDPQDLYSSAGVEFTADLNLFYLVPVRARLGVAHGFDDVIGETRAYLSFGSSF